MPLAVGIKFTREAFSQYFDPGDLELAVDDYCVARDRDLGFDRVGFVSCIEGRAAIQMKTLPRVARRANEREIEDWHALQERQREALHVVRERAEAHALPMKAGLVTFVPDRAQVLVHFTADQRVDFRELVKDLSGRFRARVEMWQIGARKEAAMMDGLGICGHKLCCSNWLKDFPSISMRHAKEQDIVQPPSKLSGPCGRLRCCLRYEHEQYVAMSVGAPALGCAGGCGSTCGIVVDRNLLERKATLRAQDGSLSRVSFDDFVPAQGEGPPRESRESRPAKEGRPARPAAPSRAGEPARAARTTERRAEGTSEDVRSRSDRGPDADAPPPGRRPASRPDPRPGPRPEGARESRAPEPGTNDSTAEPRRNRASRRSRERSESHPQGPAPTPSRNPAPETIARVDASAPVLAPRPDAPGETRADSATSGDEADRGRRTRRSRRSRGRGRGGDDERPS